MAKLHDVCESMARAVMERHENPTEWPTAVRRIVEEAGLRAERIDLNGSLYMACFRVAAEAEAGGNAGGLDALLGTIARYAEGNNSRAFLFELDAAARAYAEASSSGSPIAEVAARLHRAALAHAKAAAR